MLTQELGGRLEAIRYETLPPETVEKAKTAILNFFGGSLAGAQSPLVAAEKRLWADQGCAGNCVILRHTGRAAPLATASVNALMGQIFLLEDCHEATISHPGIVVVPVTMALGQSLGLDGKRAIEAVVTGYESIGRIGAVLIAPGFSENGLRPASTMAPFGGAAAATKVLGLDAAGIGAALAIAGNTASGVMEFVNAGTGDICIQNCFAAKNAMQAALLAANGAGAAPTILEGRFGLGRALNGAELDWGEALEDRSGYAIDESFVKRYPGCGHVLATAQAAASLAGRRRIDPDDVEQVTVGVSRGAKTFPGVDFAGPYTGTISAMMSHQFMVASTLVHGEVSVKTVEQYNHPEVCALARRVVVEVDSEIDAAHPHKTGAKLTVYLKNGAVIRNRQEDLRPLERDEVIARLRTYGDSPPLGARRVDEIIEKTLRLETLETVSGLMDLLAPDEPGRAGEN